MEEEKDVIRVWRHDDKSQVLILEKHEDIYTEDTYYSVNFADRNHSENDWADRYSKRNDAVDDATDWLRNHSDGLPGRD